MVSDPFVDAFGDDDDDGNDVTEEEIDSLQIPAAASEIHGEGVGRMYQRTQENGVLSFHNGTEHSLLLFVEQAVKRHLSSSAHEQQQKSSRQLVLNAIDQYCFERHWMMHVGPDKGRIVQDFLRDRIIPQNERQQSLNRTYKVVELGTYCGYSTIRIADTLLQNSQFAPKFHIHTIDVNAQTQNIAKQLIKLAGLEQYVSFILRQSTETIHQPMVSLTQQLTDSLLDQATDIATSTFIEMEKRIDFLFVDHAKEMYLSDLQQLESCGFIRQGSAIAADNVIFFQLFDYCQYMSSLQSMGVVETKLMTENIYLEYTPNTADNELRDGIELTVYLKDPI